MDVGGMARSTSCVAALIAIAPRPDYLGAGTLSGRTHELDHQLCPAPDQLDLFAARDTGQFVDQMR